MRTNVRGYRDFELLNKVEEIGGIIPNRGQYLIIGVQSQEDEFNKFDDKFYVFDGPDFKQVSSGTTNAGKTALKYFDNYNLPGVAVWKTNMFYQDLFSPGYHKPSRRGGGMRALRQRKDIYYYRDIDKDNKAEEIGTLHKGIIYANMHGVSYNPYSTLKKEEIGGWSFACQAWNNMTDYRNMIKATWKRKKAVDYALIKEF